MQQLLQGLRRSSFAEARSTQVAIHLTAPRSVMQTLLNINPLFLPLNPIDFDLFIMVAGDYELNSGDTLASRSIH
jgi:hypothetical protein